ncbi:hypothetical protein D3C78_878370 [compost metagenome]
MTASIIAPFETPLQPQTISSFGIAAMRSAGDLPEPPAVPINSPYSSSVISVPFLIHCCMTAESVTSPNRTPPTIMRSFSSSFLYVFFHSS